MTGNGKFFNLYNHDFIATGERTRDQARRLMEAIVRRFFKESQFKRSCIANAPKVGSGGTLHRARRLACAERWRDDGVA